MREKLLALVRRFRMVLSYFSGSVLSTVFDVALVWLLLHRFHLPLVTANTAGVVTGFVVGFFFHVRQTFTTRYTPLTFTVYLLTFLLGLAAANWLIATSYALVSPYLSETWSFLVSKGVSVAVPFFGLYFLRKWLYGLVRAWEERRG